jgi:hypothetical protein
LFKLFNEHFADLTSRAEDENRWFS